MKDQHVTTFSKSSVALSRSWVFGLSPLFVHGSTRRRLTYSLLNMHQHDVHHLLKGSYVLVPEHINPFQKTVYNACYIYVFFFDFLVLLKFLVYVLTCMQVCFTALTKPPSAVDLSLFPALQMLETQLLVKVLNEQGLLYPRLYFQFASHARLRCLL